jgi:hypothetical protein
MMRIMFLSRHSSSLVARITLVALLFCHGLALANASVGGDTGITSAAAVGDCHSVASDPETPRSATNACDLAQAASEAFQLPVVTLPVLFTAVGAQFEIAGGVPAIRTSPVATSGAPPPLHLLHCRLRN